MNDKTKKALSKNDTKYFSELTDSIELNEPDKAGRSLLFLAIMKQKKEIARILVEKELNFAVQANDGRSLMYIAAQYDEAELIEKLHSKGVDLNLPDKGGLTPLMIAAQCSSKGAIQKLLQLGARVDMLDGEGTNVLTQCGLYDDVETFRMLIQAGADPNHCPNEILHRYIHDGAEEVLKEFISLKPRIDMTDLRTFQMAFSRKGSPKEDRVITGLIKLLVENGYTLTHKDQLNRTIAWFLAENKYYDALVYLAQLGYKMDEGDILDESPKTLVRKNRAPKAVLDALGA